MIRLFRTDAHNEDFVNLVSELDRDLKISDGDEHAFYAQYNKIIGIRHVVLATIDLAAVSCGAVKPYKKQVMEVKRMFVKPKVRGLGLASRILHELESCSSEPGARKCILKTGQNQLGAMALYEKNAYTRIPNYGQYAQAKNSYCYEKLLPQ